jgi:hypothetical protein
MGSFEDLVEERIRKAKEKGAFENLEGKGKPLDLSENPFEPPEMAMAYRMLKNAGFAPYWAELGKDIDAAKEVLEEETGRFTKYCRVVASSREFFQGKRFKDRESRFYLDQQAKLSKINTMIDEFNLHCPTFHQTRGRLNVREEMSRITAEVEKAIKTITDGMK